MWSNCNVVFCCNLLQTLTRRKNNPLLLGANFLWAQRDGSAYFPLTLIFKHGSKEKSCAQKRPLNCLLKRRSCPMKHSNHRIVSDRARSCCISKWAQKLEMSINYNRICRFVRLECHLFKAFRPVLQWTPRRAALLGEIWKAPNRGEREP